MSSAGPGQDDLLDRFSAITWTVGDDAHTVLLGLVQLGCGSPWPKVLTKDSPHGCVRQIYEACRAFSGGTLTIRSLEDWVKAYVAKEGGELIPSPYHRLTGRLRLERAYAQTFLRMFFAFWGGPLRAGVSGAEHGWQGDSNQRYFGLPVPNPNNAVERILAELYPERNTVPSDFDLFQAGCTRIIAGRYQCLLGPPRGGGLQKFYEKISAELKSESSTGILAFVVDLGLGRADDFLDFQKYYNTMELYTAISALRLFGLGENGTHAPPSWKITPTVTSQDMTLQTPPTLPPGFWSRRSASRNVQPEALPARPSGGFWSRVPQPNSMFADDGSQTGGDANLWSSACKRIAVAVHGLKAPKRQRIQENAVADWATGGGTREDAERMIDAVAKNVQLPFGLRHIFPRGQPIGLKQAFTESGMRDVQFLPLNIKIDHVPNGYLMTHSYFWTKPLTESAFDSSNDSSATKWWDQPGELSGNTEWRPLEESLSEDAFSMLDQAVRLRLRQLDGTVFSIDDGLGAYAYLSHKLNMTVMSLDEFLAVLPVQPVLSENQENQTS